MAAVNDGISGEPRVHPHRNWERTPVPLNDEQHARWQILKTPNVALGTFLPMKEHRRKVVSPAMSRHFRLPNPQKRLITAFAR
jgi:hypothetical protein